MNPNAPQPHTHAEGEDHDNDHPAADEGMDDDAKAEAKAVAERRVRLGLLLTEIGRVNNVEVSEEDTRQAVFEEARRYSGQEQQVLEYFQKNSEAMQQLAGLIFEDKTVDFILEMASVTEVETDTDTLYAALGRNGSACKAGKERRQEKGSQESGSEICNRKEGGTEKGCGEKDYCQKGCQEIVYRQ